MCTYIHKPVTIDSAPFDSYKKHKMLNKKGCFASTYTRLHLSKNKANIVF